MRQLGAIAISRASPKLAHGARLPTNHTVEALAIRFLKFRRCHAGDPIVRQRNAPVQRAGGFRVRLVIQRPNVDYRLHPCRRPEAVPPPAPPTFPCLIGTQFAAGVPVRSRRLRDSDLGTGTAIAWSVFTLFSNSAMRLILLGDRAPELRRFVFLLQFLQPPVLIGDRALKLGDFRPGFPLAPCRRWPALVPLQVRDQRPRKKAATQSQ